MTKLKCNILNINTGRELVIFLNENSEVVKTEGFKALSRVKIFNEKLYAYATVYLSNIVKENEVGLSNKIREKLNATAGEEFEIKHMEPLTSFNVNLLFWVRFASFLSPATWLETLRHTFAFVSS